MNNPTRHPFRSTTHANPNRPQSSSPRLLSPWFWVASRNASGFNRISSMVRLSLDVDIVLSHWLKRLKRTSWVAFACGIFQIADIAGCWHQKSLIRVVMTSIKSALMPQPAAARTSAGINFLSARNIAHGCRQSVRNGLRQNRPDILFLPLSESCGNHLRACYSQRRCLGRSREFIDFQWTDLTGQNFHVPGAHKLAFQVNRFAGFSRRQQDMRLTAEIGGIWIKSTTPRFERPIRVGEITYHWNALCIAHLCKISRPSSIPMP